MSRLIPGRSGRDCLSQYTISLTVPTRKPNLLTKSDIIYKVLKTHSPTPVPDGVETCTFARRKPAEESGDAGRTGGSGKGGRTRAGNGRVRYSSWASTEEYIA